MYSRFAVLILFVLASCADTPKPLDCKQYKNGKYRFNFNYGGRIVQFVVERNNGNQTERCAELGAFGYFKVNWKDDCNYQLVYLNGADSLPPEAKERRRKMVTYTKILSGTDNYYLYEATNNLNDNVMNDTMWLIK